MSKECCSPDCPICGPKERLEMIEFANTHKGELVLFQDRVVKLEGFYEDAIDYYYQIIELRNNFSEDNKRIYVSGCGWTPVILKGKLSDEEYKDLKELFGLNISEEPE